ncbi:MAG TPA: CHAT domain-containing protein [Thermoanaerobaculia bacterium]
MWVQLAKEASLISGRPVDLAECLNFRGVLLQDLHEESSGTADSCAAGTQLLDEALQCMLEALAIRERLDDQESLALALGHVSSVYHRLGKDLLAFIYRLDSLVHADPSAEDHGVPIRNLAALFWRLSDKESREASNLLLQNAETLKQLVRRTDPLTRGDLFDILGEACWEADQHEMALQSWRQAGAEYSASDKPTRAFYVWARAQDLAYRREEPKEIVEFGLQCTRTAPEDVSAEALASRYHLLAFGYDAIGRTEAAIAAYHDAARVACRSEDDALPGIYLLEAAHLEQECGMLEEACEDFEKVLSGPAGAFTFWDAESGLAEVFRRKGDLGAAIHWCEEAVALSIVNRMSFALRVSALYLSSFLHFQAGDYGIALVRCGDLLQFFETESVTPQPILWYHTNRLFPHCVVTPVPSAVALLGLMAAQLRGSRKDVERYLDLYLRSFAQEQAQTVETDTEAEALPHELRQFARAECLLVIDPQQAIETLRASLPVLENQGLVPVPAHSTLGLAHFILGNTIQAQTHFNRVLELIVQYPSVEDEINAHYFLGLIEMHAGSLETAYDEFSAVIRAKEAQRGSLADLDLRQGFPRGAYHALIEVCRRLGRTHELVETVEKLKSRVLLDLLALPQHRPIDYRSLRDLKKLKEKRESHNRQFLVETNQQSMRRLEELMAEDPEKAEASQMAGINLGRRRDEMTERLLQHGFLFKLDSQVSALSFDEIRDLCASANHRVVLVEYLVTSTEVLVLGVRADLEHPQLAVVPIPKDRLSALARSGLARLGLRGGAVEGTWQQDMAQLLAPALAWSNEGDLLWLVPHGPLHGLPLHAVKVSGRYVIERNPVCYSASASILKYCRNNRRGWRETALVLGDPADNLPNARREAQLVAEMFGTTAFLGREATKSRLREALERSGPPDILHFAGHSLFRSTQPLESAMELAPGGGAQSPDDGSQTGVLTAGEIFALSLRTDLVTLSSCASGAQKVGLGDEPVGFARAFLYAGAASVLASLWPVDDLSTRVLMERFYRSLRQGLSKAEALRRAQLHLLHLTAREVADFRRSERGDLEADAGPPHRTLTRDLTATTAHGTAADAHPYSHPHFWASFTLMGDWN